MNINDLPTLAEIQREKVKRGGLKQFIKYAWPIVEPTTPLEWNWHLDAVCDHVEALYKGDIQKLLITIPPGMMKSLICSVFAPAWKWTTNPEERLLYVACTKALSTRDSIKTRNIITSHWYKDRWGHMFDLKDDQNNTTKFENSKTGYRLTSSVDGTVTGERANIITCDDLLQVLFAESPAYQKAASTFLWEVLPSRFNDQRTGRWLMICQRVHSNDPAGQVLDKEKNKIQDDKSWVHLNLPMEREPIICSTRLGFSDPRTEEGIALDPKRFPPAVIADLQSSLGSYAYAGQYQQRPVPREGGLIKEEWLKNRFDVQELNLANLLLRKPLMIVQSADCASKAKEHNDPTVIGTWGVWKDHVELWNVTKKRMEFPEGKKKFKELASAWAPNLILIEDKDAGQQYIQQLRDPQEKFNFQIKPMDPEGLDKFTRMSSEAVYIENHNLWLPEMAPWLSEYISELTTFNLGAAHDDQVDMTSQFLKWLRLYFRYSQSVTLPDDLEQISSHLII